MTIKEQCLPDNHRWEYWHIHNGEEWEICAACGETRFRYHDTASGG